MILQLHRITELSGGFLYSAGSICRNLQSRKTSTILSMGLVYLADTITHPTGLSSRFNLQESIALCCAFSLGCLQGSAVFACKVVQCYILVYKKDIAAFWDGLHALVFKMPSFHGFMYKVLQLPGLPANHCSSFESDMPMRKKGYCV